MQLKGLELVNRIMDWLREERGQTSAEYVAVTAVGVALAIAVLWFFLSEAIEAAIGSIATMLTDFVADPMGSGGGS